MSRKRARVASTQSHPILGPDRDVKEIPLGPDEVGQPLYSSDDGEKRTTFILPTVSMKMLLSHARDQGLPRQLDAEIEKRMRPSGQHFASHLTRVTSGTRSFIRANVWLVFGESSTPHSYILDLPLKQVGTILDAQERSHLFSQTKKSRTEQESHLPAPRWVGSHSFDKVYAHLSDFQRRLYSWPEGTPTTARLMIGDSARFAMQRAHVVCIEPEQAQVLPEWESAGTAWDFAQDVMLPFEYLYLDFEGPGGMGTVVNSPSGLRDDFMTLTLRGAVVWREADDSLVIAPIGWPDSTEHATSRNTLLPDTTDYEPMGVCILGAGEFVNGRKQISEMDDEMFTVRMALDDRRVWCDALARSTASLGQGDPTPGFLEFPFSHASAQKHGLGNDGIGRWSQSLVWLTSRVLAALSILEADEVELVEAPVEKRDRKRAEKRGWPIAQTVHIRSNRRYANANPPSGEEAHYSHRFWVRAHVKHFPVGTRTADARPDLCKPCQRCGYCRRVKTPAFIKGPEDAPLVLKSLITKKKEVVHG